MYNKLQTYALMVQSLRFQSWLIWKHLGHIQSENFALRFAIVFRLNDPFPQNSLKEYAEIKLRLIPILISNFWPIRKYICWMRYKLGEAQQPQVLNSLLTYINVLMDGSICLVCW